MKLKHDPTPDKEPTIPFSQEATPIVLNKEESQRLAEMLLDPSPPNAALKKLMAEED